MLGDTRDNNQESFTTDFRLLKLDANGKILWTHTYGGEDYDYGMSVIQTMDDGYALTGYTASYGAGSADAWLIKNRCFGEGRVGAYLW